MVVQASASFDPITASAQLHRSQHGERRQRQSSNRGPVIDTPIGEVSGGEVASVLNADSNRERLERTNQLAQDKMVDYGVNQATDYLTKQFTGDGAALQAKKGKGGAMGGGAISAAGLKNPLSKTPTGSGAIETNRTRNEQEAFLRAQNKRRIEAASRAPLSADILAAGNAVPDEHMDEALKIANTYKSTRDGLAKKLGDSDAFKQQVEGAKKKAIKQLNKLATKGVNKGTEIVYRIIGDAAPADVGEVAFVELVTGTTVNTIRLLLTFFKLKERGVGGTFAKYASEMGAESVGIKDLSKRQSLFAAFLPSEMDLKDPSVWTVDIPIGVMGLFVLLMIIGIAHIILAMIGVLVGGGVLIAGNVASFFGY